MINAYNKLYVGLAQKNLGRMLDYLVNTGGYALEESWDMFLVSNASRRFEQGDCSIIAGLSGIELAYEVLRDANQPVEDKNVLCEINKSREYWTGWSIAYYQWKTAIKFYEINEIASITDIRDMYNPYHEMDSEHFVDKMNALYWDKNQLTHLEERRCLMRLSQSELSQLSNVSVRTIQQYEQRQKDINKAKAETLFRFSKLLKCDMEDLLEKIPCNN